MAIKSVYIPTPDIDGDVIRVRDDEHHHLTVSRVGINECIEVFDGRGRVWDAMIFEVKRRETLARITGSRRVESDRHELILGQSLIRSAAFEFALEKAVETGATRIIPIIAARSNVKDWKAERWQRIIIEAAKQSKRYHLPLLEEPVLFGKILELEAQTKIMFAERNGSELKPALKGSPVLYLIGPEGGWTEAEMNLAVQKGFALVGLGSSILKSETAAVVATSILRYELQNRG